MQIGYLGPKGTFSEKAAICYLPNSERIAYQSISEVIQSVNTNNIELGIVPIENSIEGTVNETIDMLIFNSNVKIIDEIIISIDQDFLVSKNYNGEKITKVLSHPQGLGQCRNFLNSMYPDSEQISTKSTAEAARLTSESTEPLGALGNSLCAELYNMKTLHKKVQDNKTNETTFIVISKNNNLQNINGKFKTNIAFSTVNRPGALFKILNILELWDINMTKIVSRPMKDSIGEYAFFVEVEGNIIDSDIQNAIKMIQRKTSFYKIFGSYNIFTK